MTRAPPPRSPARPGPSSRAFSPCGGPLNTAGTRRYISMPRKGSVTRLASVPGSFWVDAGILHPERQDACRRWWMCPEYTGVHAGVIPGRWWSCFVRGALDWQRAGWCCFWESALWTGRVGFVASSSNWFDWCFDKYNQGYSTHFCEHCWIFPGPAGKTFDNWLCLQNWVNVRISPLFQKKDYQKLPKLNGLLYK